MMRANTHPILPVPGPMNLAVDSEKEGDGTAPWKAIRQGARLKMKG